MTQTKNTRTIVEAASFVRARQPNFADDATLKDWLCAQDGAFKWLLAHSEAGVTWGACTPPDPNIPNHKRTLLTSKYADAKPLTLNGLWQVRLFGPTAELLTWRDGDGAWQAVNTSDTGDTSDGPAPGDALANYDGHYDEAHMLWGDRAVLSKDDAPFTIMTDGAQGLQHIVPLPVTIQTQDDDQSDARPLRLIVRHYLTLDAQQGWQVVASRLVDLQAHLQVHM